MPYSRCEICGERPKKGESSKGYFRVPNDNVAKGQWQSVIQSEVTLSTRVCYRHWAREHLELTTKVSYKEGMYNFSKIKQDQVAEIYENFPSKQQGEVHEFFVRNFRSRGCKKKSKKLIQVPNSSFFV